MNINKLPPVVAGICMLFVICQSAATQANMKTEIIPNSPSVIRGLQFTAMRGAPKLLVNAGKKIIELK